MAEDVSILQEIDEALRADRVEHLWKRYSGAIMACCALIVLSSIVSVLWKNHQHAAHEQQTDLILKANTLAAAAKYDEAITLYEKAESSGGALASLAALRHADALLNFKQQDKAIVLLGDIASGKTGGSSEALRDYARLKADILTPEAKPARSGAFRQSEAELAALRALGKGDSKNAAMLLGSIIGDDTASLTARIRAEEILDSVKEDKK